MQETNGENERASPKHNGIDIVAIGRMGLVPELIEQYIIDCCLGVSVGTKTDKEDSSKVDEAKSTTRKKRIAKKHEKRSWFPNTAGFCRYYGIGRGELERLRTELPLEYDALCSVFEDEALNFDVSATIMNSYLKKRLGYDEKPSANGEDDGTVIPVFEHDIGKDGA